MIAFTKYCQTNRKPIRCQRIYPFALESSFWRAHTANFLFSSSPQTENQLWFPVNHYSAWNQFIHQLSSTVDYISNNASTNVKIYSRHDWRLNICTRKPPNGIHNNPISVWTNFLSAVSRSDSLQWEYSEKESLLFMYAWMAKKK